MRKLPDDEPPGVQSAMMLPVKHEGEVVGVVQLMHETVRYDEEQLELAEGLVGLMAAAVRNARLHEHGAGRGGGEGAGRGDGRRARAGGARARGGRRRRVPGRPDGACASGTAPPSSSPDARARTWSAGRRPRCFAGWAGGRRRDPDLRGGRARRRAGDAAGRGRRQRALALVRRRPQPERRRLRVPRPDRRARGSRRRRATSSRRVSHELRTPMTAVLGAAKTLLRDDIDARARSGATSCSR